MTPGPPPLLLFLDEGLRRAIVRQLALGRRALRSAGHPTHRGVDELTAALAALNGQENAETPWWAPTDEPELVSYETAAQRLGISPRSVRRLVAAGALQAVPIGRRRLVRADDVTALAQGGRRVG